ncbi:MAG: ATP-dependent DNA helicase RecG [Nitriliruptorales bacterium]|nr:ATP-dependent DNA helicase RecG [Nitriliruptorales bacterium]
MTALDLDDPVTVLPGIGRKAASTLAEAFGIETVRDVLTHYPFRHHDLGDLTDVPGLTVGETQTVIGEVVDWTTKRIPGRNRRGSKRPLEITEGTVQGEGGFFTVTFFNQSWRARQLPPGSRVVFSGKVKAFRGQVQIQSPDVQLVGTESGTTGSGEELLEILDRNQLIPVYRGTSTFGTRRFQTLVAQLLDDLPPFREFLPERLLDELDLLALDDAIRGMHFPPDRATRDAARRRLVFDELLTLQVGLQGRRARLEAELAGLDNALIDDGRRATFVASLPFELTDGQVAAMEEIAADLAAPRPMHRLLQGDVGVGKTVVAVETMLAAVDKGRQAAMLVPTSVLAEQHWGSLLDLLEPLHVNMFDGIRVEVLTGSTTQTERRRILSALLTGETDILIGTHALLEEEVRFADLGVVIIDEQHRFGVSQRLTLRDKSNGDVLPDVLVMTATPIPRSLALTLYGDLDVTVIRQPPAGRVPIRTELITPNEAARRDRLWGYIRTEAANGRQAYVVCPLVSASQEVGATAAEDHFRLLRDEVFPTLAVDLVHGQMRSDDKDAAMARFRAGDTDVLVATTVIEVGVDVPNATVMVIEDAERFGISQLHQLRGRVGRGSDESWCVLFAGWNSELTDEAKERLAAIVRTTDGFELAEADLRLRRSGQLFGERQSGVTDLHIADLHEDMETIIQTRDLARQIVSDDPELVAPEHVSLRREVHRRYGGLADLEALQSG